MTDIHSTDRHDERLDRALDLLRSTEPDPRAAEEAADRVWERLRAAARSEEGTDAPVALDAIEGCDDVQALLPAFLAGELPANRALLVEDHTRECIPCRRALKAAREGAPAATAEAERSRPSGGAGPVWSRWALAAALVAALGAGMLLVRGLWPAGPVGAIRTVDGNLFRVAEDLQVPIRTGDQLLEGEIVRTGRGGGAVLELRDGSLVEMRARSELRIRESHRGATIHLERGAVIVQAAPQGAGHLFVDTEDCEVAVTGTIFSVDHGTRGSRVAVIEGEVRVEHSGREDTLAPGDLVSTQEAAFAAPAIEREIAWSRDVDRYLELLAAYDALERDLDEQVLPPGLRYDSRLLDLVPADTVLYAALPNVGETIAETHRIVRENMAESPVLDEWWQEGRVGELEDWTADIVRRLEELGETLGDEIVVSGQRTPGGDLDGPVVLAEIVDGPGLRDLIERTWAEVPAEGHEEADLVIVDDPADAVPGTDATLWIWIPESAGLFVATPDAARLREVAATVAGADNPFVGSDFHSSLAALYEEGAEILVGVDLEHAIAADDDAEAHEVLARSGFSEARHLMIEQKAGGGRVQHRAAVTFSGERRGLASWLAEPAPMGALEFVSPQASLVGAAVFKDPVALFDDVHGLAGDDPGPAGFLASFEQEYGLSFRDDVAGALGGEIAFAIDGPILPTPSWKMILEVYDPARIQWALGQAVAEANVQLASEGEPEIQLLEERSGGRTWYALSTGSFSVHYTFDAGYWVMAASRALVDRALQYRDAGMTITESSRFTALLPADGRNNFSCLVYQDLGGLVEGIAERIARGDLTEEQRETVEMIRDNAAPGLGYAYGEPDRILFAASSETDVLRTAVLQLLGLRNPAGMAELLPEIFAGI